jgi:hypothetical protein
MKKAIPLVILFFSATLLFGQDKSEQGKTEPAKTAQTSTASSKNPVSDAVREILARQKNNLLAAVDEMPADKFGYSPTPAQMTFGHLVMHTTMSNIDLCSKAGSMPPPPMKPAAETDKVRLQASLTKSFLYCEAALGRVDDSKLGNQIEFFGGRQVTVASALISLTNDWADHYSAVAIYLRLNGLLPPTAQPNK